MWLFCNNHHNNFEAKHLEVPLINYRTVKCRSEYLPPTELSAVNINSQILCVKYVKGKSISQEKFNCKQKIYRISFVAN